LAAVRDPALVTAAIAGPLGVRDEGPLPLADRLAMLRRDRHLLLLLDNFEQVAAAPVVARLLTACPRLKALVTSWSPLRISGEHDYLVAPLALPDPAQSLPFDQLAYGAAVHLFDARAAFFLAPVEAGSPALVGPQQGRWLDQLEVEHANLSEAIDWSIAQGDEETALRLAASLWELWDMRGFLAVGRTWLERAAAIASGPSRLRARALHGAGALAAIQRDFARATVALEEAVLATAVAAVRLAGGAAVVAAPPAEGTPLATVLALAGIGDDAVDVVCQGGDFVGMRRGLPIAVARSPETLLVWRMNGTDLPAAHGGPVRLLVPGWAGIASTKWLVGLEVLDRAFAGVWNDENDLVWTAAGEPVRPVREMPPKSIIAFPAAGARLLTGRHLLHGYAWSGYAAGRGVDVSTDGGQTWYGAALRTAGRRAWARFEHPWQADPGLHCLSARATDERGLTQPAVPTWNAKGYQTNAIQEIVVTVES
jgi:DMSO/TMAO reductase YedYZ molybdopterin-dependent catalytic subunit